MESAHQAPRWLCRHQLQPPRSPIQLSGAYLIGVHRVMLIASSCGSRLRPQAGGASLIRSRIVLGERMTPRRQGAARCSCSAPALPSLPEQPGGDRLLPLVSVGLVAGVCRPHFWK